jgi:hypothetical protein
MRITKLAAFKLSASLSLSLDVSNVGINPGLGFLEHFEQQDYTQRFAWFPSAVTFFPVGDTGIFWIEVFLGDSYEIDENPDYAVIVPFTVSVEDAIQVGADDRDEIRIVRGIPRGVYKLVYQERFLIQSEIDNMLVDLPRSEPEAEPWLSLGPKICKITLVPASTKVAPELLRDPEGTTIKLPLTLHD